jgi:hypothetical protein
MLKATPEQGDLFAAENVLRQYVVSNMARNVKVFTTSGTAGEVRKAVNDVYDGFPLLLNGLRQLPEDAEVTLLKEPEIIAIRAYQEQAVLDQVIADLETKYADSQKAIFEMDMKLAERDAQVASLKTQLAKTSAIIVPPGFRKSVNLSRITCGQWLDTTRMNAELKQTELGVILGVKDTRISQWECDKRDISKADYESIKKKLSANDIYYTIYDELWHVNIGEKLRRLFEGCEAWAATMFKVSEDRIREYWCTGRSVPWDKFQTIISTMNLPMDFFTSCC